jgi:hypothetical protein
MKTDSQEKKLADDHHWKSLKASLVTTKAFCTLSPVSPFSTQILICSPAQEQIFWSDLSN